MVFVLLLLFAVTALVMAMKPVLLVNRIVVPANFLGVQAVQQVQAVHQVEVLTVQHHLEHQNLVLLQHGFKVRYVSGTQPTAKKYQLVLTSAVKESKDVFQITYRSVFHSLLQNGLTHKNAH